MSIKIDTYSNLQKLNPSELKDWDSFCHNHVDSKIYYQSDWFDLILSLFNHETYLIRSVDKENNIQGVLPLTRLKSLLFGDYIVSLPYFNYGGILANNIQIEKDIILSGNELAQSLAVSHIEYRHSKQHTFSLPVKTDKITMLLNLPDKPEHLWQSLGSKRRAQIKRPLRENPTIHIGNDELLDDFYKVFACNMRDLGTPVYNKSFFRNILTTFKKNSKIIIIRIDNEPVAAGFLIAYKETLEIPWASTLRKVNNISINMLLYWEVLKYAIEQSFKYFDFGRCSINSGTYKFKKQWGAQPKQLFWHYWLRDNQDLPEINPNNPKYKLAIQCWQKLPVAITKLIGPHLVKNLP